MTFEDTRRAAVAEAIARIAFSTLATISGQARPHALRGWGTPSSGALSPSTPTRVVTAPSEEP